MDVFEAIHTRRSVRKFTQDPVSEEAIKTMLSAAMVGPTAGNGQTWRFVVVTDKDLLAKIPTVQKHAYMATRSAATIIMCADSGAERYEGREYWVQDCAAAMQNMLLAARALGLGACWCGLHPVKEWEDGIREIFAIPEHIHILGLCAIGHAARPQERADRFDPEKVHYNRWQVLHNLV